MKNKVLLAGNILMLLLFYVTSVFATDAWVPDKTLRDKPGEIIVGFSPKATSTQRNDAISSIGGKILGQFSAPKGRTVRIKLPSTDQAAADAAINALKTNPAIRYAEPNVVRRAFWENRSGGGISVFSQSGDLMLQNQWGYYDINANWVNAPSTTTGVTVAVIDTGVDYNHPDLVKKVVKGYDFVNADSDPMDDFGHGTHVAGIIAAQANNNFGIAGVSWNAKILAIKVLDSSGSGNDWDVSMGIYAAANNSSVKVINMSLGGGWSQLEQDAVDYAVNTKGKLLVAAAGNSNSNDNSVATSSAFPAALNQFPAFANKVLAVAAHGSDHCRGTNINGPFSNYGPWVDITAPGVNILSTVPVSLPTELSGDGSGYNYLDGTSMAAPHVAGTAALAWEKYKTYTNVQIAGLIKTNTATYSLLTRDGTCWPSDGALFQRLNVMHILDQQLFEQCTSSTRGQIYGYAFDAESGLPLIGGKVAAKQGTTTATDFVPDYGYLNFFGNQSIYIGGLGLFNVVTNEGVNTLTITQKNYMTYTPKGQDGKATTIAVDPCLWSFAGNIPVPPNKQTYWLSVTWNYGSVYSYDLYLYALDKNNYYLGEVDSVYPGDLNTAPYAKLYWDAYYYYYYGIVDPRQWAETICVRKLYSGVKYLFFINDWLGGSGSANWGTYGIKAYLYKGNQLVKTYTPPSGTGEVWTIAEINNGKLVDINYVGTNPVVAAAMGVTQQINATVTHDRQERPDIVK